jgi:hypothetical protein
MRVLVVTTGLLAGLALEDTVLILLLALPPLLVTALLAQVVLGSPTVLDKQAQHTARVVGAAAVMAQTTLLV